MEECDWRRFQRGKQYELDSPSVQYNYSLESQVFFITKVLLFFIIKKYLKTKF